MTVYRHYTNSYCHIPVFTNYKRLATHAVCIDLFIVYDISII